LRRGCGRSRRQSRSRGSSRRRGRSRRAGSGWGWVLPRLFFYSEPLQRGCRSPTVLQLRRQIVFAWDKVPHAKCHDRRRLAGTEGIRDYCPAVMPDHFQQQFIFGERSPWRWLDRDPDLDHLRLVRSEYSVGRIENRDLQTGRCLLRLCRSVLGK